MALKSIPDPEARVIFSKIQAAAIAELVSQNGLESISSECRASLVCLASDAPWAPGDLVTVLKALSPPEPIDGSAKTKKKRSSTQVWAPAILGYIPANLWEQLHSCTNWVESQDFLINFVLSLGGRCLSEPTSKCLTSLSLLVTDPNARLLPIASKEAAFQKFKREFKKRARPLTMPSTWIEQLPPSPMELQRTCPEVFDLLYAQDPPVAAKVNLGQLMVVDSSFSCRGGAMSRTLMPDASAHQGDGAMALMSQMIALQQQNMQLIMSSSTSTPRGGLASLRSLSNGPSTIQRCMTIPESQDSLDISRPSSESEPITLAHVWDALASRPLTSASDASASLSPHMASVADDLLQDEPPRRNQQAPSVDIELAAPSPVADVERTSLANKMLGDYLHMEAGLRAAKKQKVTHHAETTIVSAPLQKQQASGPEASALVPRPSASVPEASVYAHPPLASVSIASVVALEGSASASGASASNAHLASTSDASMVVTPTKLVPTSAPPTSQTISLGKVEKRARNQTFRLEHMKTRNSYVARMGGGIGSNKCFKYKKGDDESQNKAFADATKFLEEAKTKDK